VIQPRHCIKPPPTGTANSTFESSGSSLWSCPGWHFRALFQPYFSYSCGQLHTVATRPFCELPSQMVVFACQELFQIVEMAGIARLAPQVAPLGSAPLRLTPCECVKAHRAFPRKLARPHGFNSHGGVSLMRRAPQGGSSHKWRWRELNPRPQEAFQAFSGRIRRDVLLGPCALAGESQTGPV